MFHCNGWGMPYAVTGMGGKHVVLSEVRGDEILKRIEEHDITYMCGAPAVVAAVLEAAQDWEGEIPGRGRVRMVVAGAPPQPGQSPVWKKSWDGNSFRFTA